MTEELSRTSALASRHKVLGSGLEDWNGMGTAWSYNTDPNDEHDAVRTAAGLFDMSPLKKVYLRGKDASKVVDHVVCRNTQGLTQGKSTYTAVLTESGTVSDDAIAANISDTEWLFCHGSGGSMERLQESAAGHNVDVEFDDDLHNIAVQGPASQTLLASHTNANLGSLKYFNHVAAEIFGLPCRLSRTGYSGEQGYEIFAASRHVGEIWDNLLGHGESDGVMPCSFAALDKVRIEAALLFYGYDMTDEHTPWEVGLGFTVGNGDFRGSQAASASKGKERFVAGGISVAHTDSLVGGETLWHDDKQVGTLNSPCWSHRLNESLALVHLDPSVNKDGQKLTVKSDDATYEATVKNIPFFDPCKSRTKT